MEQKMCDDPHLGILLTDRGSSWRAAARHNKTGRPVLVLLVPSLTDVGYWHVSVVDPAANYTDYTKRPVSPYGVGLLLPGMGVTLPCEWERFAPPTANA